MDAADGDRAVRYRDAPIDDRAWRAAHRGAGLVAVRYEDRRAVCADQRRQVGRVENDVSPSQPCLRILATMLIEHVRLVLDDIDIGAARLLHLVDLSADADVVLDDHDAERARHLGVAHRCHNDVLAAECMHPFHHQVHVDLRAGSPRLHERVPKADHLVRVTHRARPRRHDVGDLPSCRCGLVVDFLIDLARAHLIAAALAGVRAGLGKVEQMDLQALVLRLVAVETLQHLLRFLRSFGQLGLRARVNSRRRGLGHVGAVLASGVVVVAGNVRDHNLQNLMQR